MLALYYGFGCFSFLLLAFKLDEETHVENAYWRAKAKQREGRNIYWSRKYGMWDYDGPH